MPAEQLVLIVGDRSGVRSVTTRDQVLFRTTSALEARFARLAVESVNASQKTHLFEMLNKGFDGDLAGKTIAIWGLSFKPNTDDMREAPSMVLIDALLEAGANIRAHDPEAMKEALKVYGDVESFSIHDDQYDAAEGADALVLVTEWKLYWIPDYERLAANMRQKVLVDGRNIWPQDTALKHGFTCHAIGRPSVG